MEEEIQLEPVIEKPSRAERFKRSIAARLRRKETKLHKEQHSYKEEKEARERLQSKRLMNKVQKRKVRKLDYATST